MAKTEDERIRMLLDYVKEDLASLNEFRKASPSTPIEDVQVRSWLIALSIHIDHLEHMLHDIQSTLPIQTP